MSLTYQIFKKKKQLERLRNFLKQLLTVVFITKQEEIGHLLRSIFSGG